MGKVTAFSIPGITVTPTAGATVLYDASQRAYAWPRSNKALRLVRAPRTLPGDVRSLIVAVRASELDRVAELVRSASRSHRLRGLLVEQDVAPGWLPTLLHRANIRPLARLLTHADAALPERVARAWALGAEHHIIADALALDDVLVVVSGAFERLEVGWDAVPALRRLPAAECKAMCVAPDGGHLEWTNADVHLDLESLRIAAAPARHVHLLVARETYDRDRGAVIRAVREASGLRQSDVPGLSRRQLGRIERGEARPRVTTYERLAAAHGLTTAAYLDRLAAHAHTERGA